MNQELFQILLIIYDSIRIRAIKEVRRKICFFKFVNNALESKLLNFSK